MRGAAPTVSLGRGGGRRGGVEGSGTRARCDCRVRRQRGRGGAGEGRGRAGGLPGWAGRVLVRRKELGLVACSLPSAAARRSDSSEEETKRRRGWEWPGAALQPFWKDLLVFPSTHPRRAVINRTVGGGGDLWVSGDPAGAAWRSGGAVGRGRRKRSPPCPVCFSPPSVAFLAEGLPMS